MANNRKLQTEIDRLIKKVNEGMEVYDEMYEKVQNAGNQSLKEKHEAELKKEIKKLQRLRETIKGHIASPEVKDKKQLEQYRRFIEEKMESFKVCERETKTKTFSKEGLAQASERETPLMKVGSFIRNCISDLGEIIEQLEFDLASAKEATGRKKKKGSAANDDRQAKFNGLKIYVVRLEQVLRSLNNEDIEPEEIEELQPEIENFIADVADADRLDEEALEIFDVFDLPDVGTEQSDEEEEPVEEPPKQEQPKPTPKATSTPKTVEKSPAQTEAAAGGRVVMKKETTAPAAAAPPKAAPAKKEVAPAPQPAKKVASPAASVTPPAPASQQKAKAAAAAAATQPAAMKPSSPLSPQKQMPQGGLPTEADLLGGLEDDEDAFNDDTFGDDAMTGAIGNTGSLADMAGMTAKMMERGDWGKGRPDFTKLKDDAPKAAPEAPQAADSSPPSRSPAAAVAPQLPTSTPAAAAAPAAPAPAASPAARLFEMSFNNLPDAKDCERTKAFVPPNPYQTPEFYPQEVHPGFTNPEHFSKLDPDTLFFIFYYQQQTYQQYLAAKELKKQSWRYHKKFHTWFQRHDKPISTNEDFERGAYVYFDFENGWCQRIKTDFTFKYQYLEDELQ